MLSWAYSTFLSRARGFWQTNANLSMDSHVDQAIYLTQKPMVQRVCHVSTKSMHGITVIATSWSTIFVSHASQLHHDQARWPLASTEDGQAETLILTLERSRSAPDDLAAMSRGENEINSLRDVEWPTQNLQLGNPAQSGLSLFISMKPRTF